LSLNHSHDDLGRAAHIGDCDKGKHGRFGPAGYKCFEPTRDEIREQADIREGHYAAHHKNNEGADNDRKDESGLAFHRLPLAGEILAKSRPDVI